MSSDEDSKPVEIPWRKRSLEDREQMTKKRPHKNTEKTETEEDPTSDKNESTFNRIAIFNTFLKVNMTNLRKHPFFHHFSFSAVSTFLT